MLSGFVQGGISAGDGVIIIATQKHLEALQSRLSDFGVDIKKFLNTQYFPMDAKETLAKFMVNGWPDESKFINIVTNLLKKVRKNNRKVRAFGEMVAILWAEGYNGATVQLEHLWNKFCDNEVFCLYCAYPKSGFTQDINASLQHICSAHSKMILPDHQTPSDILYRRMDQKKAG